MGSPRHYLRYGQFMAELGDRPVVIGRASTCDLVTEDELASREHCRIELEGERVVLRDLASRNGVLVNGTRVSGTQELHHGDVVTIGTQQITLLRQHRAPRLTPTMSGGDDDDDDDISDQEPTRQGDIYELLHGAAVSALAEGDVINAEGSARNLFVLIRAALSRQVKVPAAVIPQAIDLALELADRSGEVRWLEQSLEVAVPARALLSFERASRFADLARRIGTPRRALGEYLRVAGELGADDAAVRKLKLL